MNDMLIHSINNESATVKRLKEDYSPIKINNFSIINSEDIYPSLSVITIRVTYTTNQVEFTKTIAISVNYVDENGILTLRNEKNGKWCFASFFRDLLIK